METKNKNTEFKNYFLISKINDGANIEIIQENNIEIGFKVAGVAVTWDVRNENGGIFKKGDFDKHIKDYFKKNALNMLCPVEHSFENWDNRGIIDVVDNTDETLNVSAIFYKDCCSKYEIIKSQVIRGLLQAFSTHGWIMDDGNAFLMDISLVSSPSDVGAKLFKNSTKFVGFENEEEKEKKDFDILL